MTSSLDVITHGIELGLTQLKNDAEAIGEEIAAFEEDRDVDLADLIFEVDRIIGWLKTSLNDLSILDDHLQAEMNK